MRAGECRTALAEELWCEDVWESGGLRGARSGSWLILASANAMIDPAKTAIVEVGGTWLHPDAPPVLQFGSFTSRAVGEPGHRRFEWIDRHCYSVVYGEYNAKAKIIHNDMVIFIKPALDFQWFEWDSANESYGAKCMVVIDTFQRCRRTLKFIRADGAKIACTRFGWRNKLRLDLGANSSTDLLLMWAHLLIVIDPYMVLGGG